MIARKCSTVYGVPIKLNKSISVGYGEKAIPVQNDSKEWIVPYAGKWYSRRDPYVPNHTEVLTVYGAYFSSKESLVKLMEYDPFMVRFVAFILMGGPVAAMNAMENAKKREALEQLHQRDRAAKGYTSRRGGGGGRRSSKGSTYTPKASKGFGL